MVGLDMLMLAYTYLQRKQIFERSLLESNKPRTNIKSTDTTTESNTKVSGCKNNN